GVDRDPLAVELAKLSLWLVALARDLPLTFLDRSLRHGDSLVGRLRSELVAGPEPVAPFHWEIELPEVFSGGPGAGFSAVVGNPPYLASFEARYEAFVAANVSAVDGRAALSGRVNTFLLFMVRATALLAPSGSAGFVLPDTI